MVKITDRLERVKERIGEACSRSGRDPKNVKLIVVTKSASIEQISEVVRLGEVDLGESKPQQLKRVSGELDEIIRNNPKLSDQKIRWHMIGHLQRNKVRQVLPIASYIHSLDTLRLAEEINSSAGKMGIVADVLMQVNCSMEPQKYGVPVGAAIHLAEQLVTFEHIKLHGLMTMAPLTEDQRAVRSSFQRARELFEEMRGEKVVGPEFSELSMGMSNDYEIAIEEGATILRVGSAIFSD